MGVSKATRNLVLKRANGLCERCGVPLDEFFYSLQHRRARGMGGSKRAGTNLPANLVALCGSATTGCHGWIESHPNDAWVEGLRLLQRDEPTEVRVATWHGMVELDNDGGYYSASHWYHP